MNKNLAKTLIVSAILFGGIFLAIRQGNIIIFILATIYFWAFCPKTYKNTSSKEVD